jgi:putative Holliday junction resolvase
MFCANDLGEDECVNRPKLFFTLYFCSMQKVLALDYGKKRTGVAETDPLQMIASGLTTLPTSKLFDFLTEYFDSNDVEKLVVGKPTQMDGSDSLIEADIADFLQKFILRFPAIPVVRVDERFTSKLAFQTMLDSGVKKMARRRKSTIDKISATIILQTYLDSKKYLPK